MNQDLINVIRTSGYLPISESPTDIFWRLSRSKIFGHSLPQSSVGLKYLDNIFPHRYMAKTYGCPSFHDAWNDDRQMGKILDYLFANGKDPDKNSFIRNLQFNVHIPSHFFPDSAAALCNTYANGGFVCDPFTGWGGRTLGAVCSNVKYFVSTDLQLKSIKSGEKLSSDFRTLSETVCEFHNDNFVNYFKSNNTKFDLILASPPFLNTEQYGEYKNISIRQWATDIIIPLVFLCKKNLTENGVIAIHSQEKTNAPLSSIIYTAFSCAGYSLQTEYKYGKKPGQSVLIFKLS